MNSEKKNKAGLVIFGVAIAAALVWLLATKP